MFKLSRRIEFPPPNLAEPDGLLAIGGDLSVERLKLAYSLGIFPWFNLGDPILWWSPDPRLVLFPEEFRVSARLERTIRSRKFRVTFDTAFDRVIAACKRAPRPGQDGTWITEDMQAAYIRLHKAGFAHSVEAWRGEQLVGGLYGVSLGAAFFGESMFARTPDASKVALAALVERLRAWEFHFIDCQVHTRHLASLGARDIPRAEFLQRLDHALERPTRSGNWANSD